MLLRFHRKLCNYNARLCVDKSMARGDIYLNSLERAKSRPKSIYHSLLPEITQDWQTAIRKDLPAMKALHVGTPEIDVKRGMAAMRSEIAASLRRIRHRMQHGAPGESMSKRGPGQIYRRYMPSGLAGYMRPEQKPDFTPKMRICYEASLSRDPALFKEANDHIRAGLLGVGMFPDAKIMANNRALASKRLRQQRAVNQSKAGIFITWTKGLKKTNPSTGV